MADLKKVRVQLLDEESGAVIEEVDVLSRADCISYGSSNVKDAIDVLNEKMEDVLYEPVNITSFTNNVNTVEMGSTVNDVTLNWNINKTPKALTLDDQPLTVSDKNKVISSAGIKANKTYTLKATDERDATATKTTAITFLNGIYYGVDVNKTSFDSAFILKLTKKLQASKATTFTVNAAASQHIYYAIPTRYGVPAFKVGGFDGGFAKVGTVEFTNASGYKENYDVWKSDNASLGNTTVVVA